MFHGPAHRLSKMVKTKSFLKDNGVFLANRFPKPQEIISVYAVGVAILYTFTLFAAFNDFSRNWVLYLSITDILSIFAYMITGAFFESLLVITALLFVGFILPPKILQGRFILYGVIMIVTFLGSLTLRDGTLVGISDILKNSRMVFTSFAVSTFVFAALGEFFTGIRKIIELIADRCVILLYVYMPLSLISVIVIVFRNIG